MISGNSVYVAMKKESTWGTVASGADVLGVKISSESLKQVFNKVNEGLATGSKGAGLMATMGKYVEGSISTLLRPDMGYLLAYALGDEDTVSGGKHTIKAISPSGTLPSNTICCNRNIGGYENYSGCKINKLTLSATAGEYLKCDVDFAGKQEAHSTGSLTFIPSSLRAFKFAQGKVYFDATEVADVKSVSIEYLNNLDYQTQTSSSGVYMVEPSQGIREINTNLEVVYSSDSETIRTNLYKTDSTFALKLEFVSDETYATDSPYKLTITIPCNQMSDATANMSSPSESLSQSMTINAVDNGTDELITVEIENGDAEKYL